MDNNLFLDDAREERTNTAICRKSLSKPTLKRDKLLRMLLESQVRQTHNQKIKMNKAIHITMLSNAEQC